MHTQRMRLIPPQTLFMSAEPLFIPSTRAGMTEADAIVSGRPSLSAMIRRHAAAFSGACFKKAAAEQEEEAGILLLRICPCWYHSRTTCAFHVDTFVKPAAVQALCVYITPREVDNDYRRSNLIFSLPLLLLGTLYPLIYRLMSPCLPLVLELFLLSPALCLVLVPALFRFFLPQELHQRRHGRRTDVRDPCSYVLERERFLQRSRSPGSH